MFTGECGGGSYTCITSMEVNAHPICIGCKLSVIFECLGMTRSRTWLKGRGEGGRAGWLSFEASE